MEDLGYEIESKAGDMVKSKDTTGADSEGPFFGSVSKGDNGLWYASFSVRVPPVSGGIISPGHRLSSLPSVVNPALVAYATTGSEVSTKQYVHFVVDSGATHTIVSTLRGVLVSPDLERVVVRLADGTFQRSEARGLFNGFLPVVYVPSFTRNICSVSAMGQAGYDLLTREARDGNRRSFIEQHTGVELAPVYRAGKLFFVDLSFDGPDDNRPFSGEPQPIMQSPARSFQDQQRRHCTNCSLASHVTENCWATSAEIQAAHLRRCEERHRRDQEEAAAAAGSPVAQGRSEGRTSLFGDGLAAGQDVELFQMGVGTLEWLSKTTHPEIGYSVSQCAKRCSAPTAEDTKELVSILSYCQKGWGEGHLRGGRSTAELENQAIGAVADILHRLICALQASGVSVVEIASDHTGATALRGPFSSAGPGEKADASATTK